MNAFNRAGKDFASYAKEPVKVVLEDDCFTVICSELASFRIAEKYKHSDRVFRGFSKNLDSFIFTLNIDGGGATSGDLRFEGNF